ncbi:MAG: 4Fe-4S dicluster domain-containing protein, partial [Deltaproteobacteria bacterium]|nr:4Fe-4S dicluster domain-containing protein [Deltaproteobacteria bacterium]
SCAARSVVVGDRESQPAALAQLIGHGQRSWLTLDSGLYPSGLKLPLIKRVTGHETPLPQADPREVGVFFVRLEEVYWAGLAVALGRPQTGKWLTVAGPNGQRSQVLVPLGTPVRHILEHLDLKPAQGGKVILGSLLTGMTIYDLTTPVTKQVDGLLVLSPQQVRSFEPQPCINCGLCVRACPMRLVPGQLSKYCEYNCFDEAEDHDLFNCIECGLCAYVCPAKRPMVQYFRHAKEEIMARRVGQ